SNSDPRSSAPLPASTGGPTASTNVVGLGGIDMTSRPPGRDRTTIGDGLCDWPESEAEVELTRDRVRTISARVDDCPRCTCRAQRMQARQACRRAEALTNIARIGPNGFQFPNPVGLVEPSEREGGQRPVGCLNNLIEVATIGPRIHHHLVD